MLKNRQASKTEPYRFQPRLPPPAAPSPTAVQAYRKTYGTSPPPARELCKQALTTEHQRKNFVPRRYLHSLWELILSWADKLLLHADHCQPFDNYARIPPPTLAQLEEVRAMLRPCKASSPPLDLAGVLSSALAARAGIDRIGEQIAHHSPLPSPQAWDHGTHHRARALKHTLTCYLHTPSAGPRDRRIGEDDEIITFGASIDMPAVPILLRLVFYPNRTTVLARATHGIPVITGTIKTVSSP